MTSGRGQAIKVQRIAELLINVAGYSDEEVEAMLDNKVVLSVDEG